MILVAYQETISCEGRKVRSAARYFFDQPEKRYRALFERVPVGLYRTTVQGKILDGNPALVRMLGFPNINALLGRQVSDLFVERTA